MPSIQSHPVKTSLSIVGLNALPLIGWILDQWQAFDLLFVYWLENIVIGVITFVRIILRRYHVNTHLFPVLGLGVFFCLHYGFFVWGHGQFFAIFSDDPATLRELVGQRHKLTAFGSRW